MKENSIAADGTSQELAEAETPFTIRTLRREAKNAYGSMIADLVGDMPAWMVTITHENQNIHPEVSVKVRTHWLNQLNRSLFGNHYDRRGVGLLSFFGIEYQESRAFKFGGRATVHQHGVVAGYELKDVNRTKQWEILRAAARGNCRIEMPRHQIKAIKYCAKYVAKDGEMDIWLPRSLLIK